MFAWFCQGTRLLAEDGEMPVEALVTGDLLVAIRRDGPPVARVARVERRVVEFRRHPAPELAQPVLVRAGAFAPGMPARDLRLAPNHAVYADGVLLAVLALCDSKHVVQDVETSPVTYIRVELESHDVILAEGLPVASSLGGADDAVALHPSFPPAVRETLCLPLLQEGQPVLEMRRVLAYRAGLATRSTSLR
jgi:hypothetical protein